MVVLLQSKWWFCLSPTPTPTPTPTFTHQKDEAPAAGRPDAQKGVREMEGPPPPRSKDMTRIMHTRLPISPRAFLQRFLSDDSHFFQRFHAGRGDKHITLSHWAMLAMGCVREMQFVSPLKYRIGPPEARCHQTQRYCLYEGDQLVFETSQVIPEIPYGDHVRCFFLGGGLYGVWCVLCCGVVMHVQ